MCRKNVFFKINFDLKIYYDIFFIFDIRILKLLKNIFDFDIMGIFSF